MNKALVPGQVGNTLPRPLIPADWQVDDTIVMQDKMESGDSIQAPRLSWSDVQ